jgi:glycosyltransferase involved in cell wall biosynthesis
MDLVHEFVSVSPIEPAERSVRRRQVLTSLGWPPNSFVVGACGALGWRKGTDLFLQIAHAMHKKGNGPEIRFLWIGGDKEGDEALRFAHDAHCFGLTERCAVVPTIANVTDYYLAMDVFALTSREDPFPLVMLEAGAYRVPTVCFEGSGGGPEFVGTDAGLVASYLDLPGFAAHLDTLRNNPALRSKMGEAAERKVREKFAAHIQNGKIFDSIQRCFATDDMASCTIG